MMTHWSLSSLDSWRTFSSSPSISLWCSCCRSAIYTTHTLYTGLHSPEAPPSLSDAPAAGPLSTQHTHYIGDYTRGKHQVRYLHNTHIIYGITLAENTRSAIYTTHTLYTGLHSRKTPGSLSTQHTHYIRDYTRGKHQVRYLHNTHIIYGMTLAENTRFAIYTTHTLYTGLHSRKTPGPLSTQHTHTGLHSRKTQVCTCTLWIQNSRK